jgi:hypothetical protein
MADVYKVELKGKTILGWARSDVIDNLTKLLKIDSDRAFELLSGEPTTIKQNISIDAAEKLVDLFTEAGAECQLVKLSAPVTSAKKANKNYIECPKCGTSQPRGPECKNCGVLFAKLKAIAEAKKQVRAAKAAGRPPFIEDLGIFIGPRKSYYLKRVEKIRQRQGGFVWTWNWWAFVGNFWWFLYRRMPMWALISFVMMCVPVLNLLSIIGFGGAANYLYFQHGKTKIGRLRQEFTYGEIPDELAAAGGVNRSVPMVAVGLSAVVIGLAVAFPFLTGFQSRSVLEAIPKTAILRPTFQTTEGFKEAGSATVVEMPEYGRYLLVTAHHLFGPDGGFAKTYAWDQIKGLVQQVNATSYADLAVMVSTSEILQIPGAQGAEDAVVNRDLAVFPLPDKPGVPSFRLSAGLPAVGARVWLFARAARAMEPGETIHEATVVQADNTGVSILFVDAGLDLTAANGAPVLNGLGEIVAINVASRRRDGNLYGFGNPATEIRQLIDEGFKM